MTTAPVVDIDLGQRHRHDLGDIAALAGIDLDEFMASAA